MFTYLHEGYIDVIRHGILILYTTFVDGQGAVFGPHFLCFDFFKRLYRCYEHRISMKIFVLGIIYQRRMCVSAKWKPRDDKQVLEIDGKWIKFLEFFQDISRILIESKSLKLKKIDEIAWIYAANMPNIVRQLFFLS